MCACTRHDYILSPSMPTTPAGNCLIRALIWLWRWTDLPAIHRKPATEGKHYHLAGFELIAAASWPLVFGGQGTAEWIDGWIGHRDRRDEG